MLEDQMKDATEEDAAAHVCPVETVIEIIGGKWKCQIIHFLLGGTRRFGEIRRQIPDVSQRVLTRKLRELEAHGIVVRKVYAEVPPRTEYSLTPTGQSLEPVMQELDCWAQANLGSSGGVV